MVAVVTIPPEDDLPVRDEKVLIDTKPYKVRHCEIAMAGRNRIPTVGVVVTLDTVAPNLER